MNENTYKNIKIIILGEPKVGKSSILRRYINNTFSKEYTPTIGVEFNMKTFQFGKDTIRIQFWDCSGQGKFKSLLSHYYRNASGALIVFDVTQDKTLDAVKLWKQEIDINFDSIPCVLLANKSDLAPKAISGQKLDNFCTENGIIKWFATSAKKNRGIEEAMGYLFQATNELQQSEGLKDVFVLQQYKQVSSPQRGSCCGVKPVNRRSETVVQSSNKQPKKLNPSLEQLGKKPKRQKHCCSLFLRCCCCCCAREDDNEDRTPLLSEPQISNQNSVGKNNEKSAEQNNSRKVEKTIQSQNTNYGTSKETKIEEVKSSRRDRSTERDPLNDDEIRLD